MEIHKIQSYLIEPGKGYEDPPPVVGLEIKYSDRLFNMLSDIFLEANEECNINIAFKMGDDGTQYNEVHSMFVEFCNEPEQSKGQPIAERLCKVTTRRSDLGLLFLMLGRRREDLMLVVSRFPAERGILANIDEVGLKLEYIERVFMKNPKYYKAACYVGKPTLSDLWSGYAIDKQVNYRNSEIAQYWIQSFLDSDYKTTSKAGSKRFALAVRQASQKSKDLSIKQEIASLAKLVGGLHGSAISISDILSKYNLSHEAKSVILNQLSDLYLADIKFQFDADEFNHHAPYFCIELDNEGILVGPSDQFNRIFIREQIKQDDDSTDIFQFSTKGRIINEQFRGRK